MKEKHQHIPSVGARIVQGLQEFVDTLQKKKPVSAQFNCHTVQLDLAPRPYQPDTVKATRNLLGASQSVFARLLGVSVKTVQAWEHGLNTPSDIACRFMDKIRHNPEYWLGRLREATVAK